MIRKTLALAAVAAITMAGAAEARDQIRIVGSSTVFPFSTTVAENFGKTTNFKTPVIESTGTGGGLKLFCAGVGVEHPDITNASRRIKTSEVETCAKNGVTEITEVKIGFDGIVLANAKTAPLFDVNKKTLFLALAKEVPVDGKWTANPYTKWSEIDPKLPAVEIEVLGPPPTSGTRDAFVELVMEAGCETLPECKELKKTDEAAFKKVFASVREDGRYIEAGENDNLIVQKLESNTKALGIFGYSFLEQNADKIQGSRVDAVDPTFENISSGKYGVSRSLYFYVKKAHVGTIPGIQEFVSAFTSDTAWGPEGYLADKGLIPLPDAERVETAKKAQALAPLAL
ncbi:PstS family phosphate ABC transporter substrate-binding protein [Pararhodospirillum photometricum]|uniref:PstS family phosphate ABC transporter substrate-binding protein n=1 Tax=Pararhodospirillum photometricum TaxID=1084 RepID=UPI0002DA0FA0|nr:PstS family phosphate ABC transporter substrate-binding protein [Pararhodospirillum photometricum]